MQPVSLFQFEIKSVPSCPSVLVSSNGDVYRRDPKHPKALLPRKQYCGKNGYFVVSVTRGQKKAPEYVHRLVGEAFHGAPQPGQVMRHLNGNSSDNSATNLKWGSYTENNHDMVLHGTKAIGQRVHGVRLDEDKVRAIRWLRQLGYRSVDIASAFGLRPKMISDVCRFKCWRYVTNAKVPPHKGCEGSGIVLRED